MTTASAPNVGAYTRLSDDRENDRLGVERQEADLRQLCALRGWDVAEVYEDDDYSAFKPNVSRPAFERMLADLAAGKIDGVAGYDLDRIFRQNTDLERAIAIYDAAGGKLKFATVQNDIDLQSNDGRTMARVLVAFANKSSLDTQRRVRDKHRQLAQQGAPVGGRRPFGWNDDKRTLNEQEAAMIRKAAEDVASGVPLHHIVREWAATGIKTPRGCEWRRTSLNEILTNPRQVGWRTYKGELMRDASGAVVKGQWEPILSVDMFERVCARLAAKWQREAGRDRHAPSVPPARKYLFSGFLRCGRVHDDGTTCTYRMHGFPHRPGRHVYTCAGRGSTGACAGLSVSGHNVDDYLTELVIQRVEALDMSSRTLEPWDGAEALADAEARLAELSKSFTSGAISGSLFFSMAPTLEKQIAELRASKTAYLSELARVESVPVSIRERWDLPEDEGGLTLAQKRDIAAQVLVAVVVHPVGKGKGGQGGNRFNPDRLQPVWRD